MSLCVQQQTHLTVIAEGKGGNAVLNNKKHRRFS